LIVLTGILAPWLVPHDPNHVDLIRKFQAPSLEYPLGTDHLGRCISSRILIAIRYSVGGSLLVTALTLSAGVVAGTVTALRGGWFDNLFMRLCDMFLAFPTLVLAFALLGMFGPGFVNLIAALVLSQWIYYARIVRGMVLSLKEKEFIKAAKLSGTRGWALIWRHVLPNISIPLLVLAALEVGGVILEITGFSFLGLGVQAPAAEWGMMINEGKAYIRQHPEMMVYPGLAIMLVVVTFNLLGESLRELYDPKER
jgi:nickel transport system permease protein